MKRILFAVLALMLSAIAAQCQTVGPLSAEFKKHAKGSFTVGNAGAVPLTVTLQPVSFTYDKGEQLIRDLSPSVHLKMSESSFRLGAKQTREVFYDATCDDALCAFAIFSNMSPGQHVNEGMSVVIHLPTSVYLCQDKQKGCRVRVREALGAKE